MKIILVLLLLISTYSTEVRLHPHLTLRWSALNPTEPLPDQLIKFELVLKNGKRGWAGIGFQRNPEKFHWRMADTDFIVCYANKEGYDDYDLGCFDGYLYTNQEIGNDGKTNWDSVIPIPVSDTLPIVGGKNDVELIDSESYRRIIGEDCITKWVFTRKAMTGDSKGDADLTKKDIKGIWAFHETDSNWEMNPRNWKEGTRPAYHTNENRGRFRFNLHQNERKQQEVNLDYEL